MGFITNLTFALAAAMSCCGAGLCIYQTVRQDDRHARARKLLTTGALTATSVLVGLFLALWGGAILGNTNLFMLIAWALLVVCIFLELYADSTLYAAFMLPLAFVALCISWFWGLTPDHIASQATLVVYEEWPVLTIHVIAFILASICFIASGAASTLLLLRSNQLKHHKQIALSQRGPSLSRLQRVASRSVIIGLPLLTLGLLLGISHGLINGSLVMSPGGDSPFFSARIVFSCLLWSCYVVYFGVTYIINVSWRVSAAISIVGATGTLIVAVLSATLPMLGA
jgi:ABC-type uncharacterized transport system permease subunit